MNNPKDKQEEYQTMVDPLLVVELQVCDIPISMKLLPIHVLEIISSFASNLTN